MDLAQSGGLVRLNTRSVAPSPMGAEDDLSKAAFALDGLHDLVIDGSGNSISCETHGDVFALRDCHNVTIQNLTIRGAGITGQPNDLFALINLIGPCSEIRVRDCRFLDFGNHAISQLNGPKLARNVTVSDCFFRNGGNAAHPVLKDDGACVSGIGSQWTVRNCTAVDCLRGFEIEGGQTLSEFQQIAIRDNRLQRMQGTGIMIFGSVGAESRFRDITIAGNFIDGLLENNRSQYGSVGILCQAGHSLTISGNTCRSFQRSGISVDCLIPGAMAAVRIIDNTSSDCLWRALQVSGTEKAIISGNVLGKAYDTATVLLPEGTHFDKLSNTVIPTEGLPEIIFK